MADPPHEPPPGADSQSEAEKIRNKRLAKLQAQPSRAASPSTSAEISTMSEAKATTAAESESQKPNSSIPIKPAPKINITKGSPSQNVRRPSALRQASEELETWTDRTLCSIFRISLRSHQTTDASGNRLIYLPNIRSELDGSKSPIQMTVDNLEQAILEAALNTSDGKPFTYLLACYKRLMRTFRGLRSTDSSQPRYEVLKETRRLCMSYCIFAITMPEMFGGEEAPDTSPLVEHFLSDPENDTGICHDFLVEAVSRFPEDPSIRDALVVALEQLSGKLAGITMNDEYKPYVTALRSAVRYRPLAEAITLSPKFLPQDVAPERIEHDTFLGPFFALSPLKVEVALDYFVGAQSQGASFIANSQHAVRQTLRTLQEELHEITNSIVKAAKEPRERLLDWFALTVNKNHKRRGTWVDTRTVASDGFMINVTTILDTLCDPFMDATFSKVDRIDVNYLRRSPRIVIADETKLNADQKTSDEFYAQPTEGTNNFISEVFFLTVAAHHYGSEAANNRISQIEREIKHAEEELEKMKAERHKFLSNPQQLSRFDSHIKRYMASIERFRCVLLALQGILLDELSQQRSMQLMRYVIAWLLRLVQPGVDYPKKQITLPLAADQSMVFRCLPEYLLEDIVDNFKFTTRNMPHSIPATQCEELITICVAFLYSSEYVKNPGLKSGLVSILYHGIWPIRGREKGILGDFLNSSEFCHKYLLHALMKFFIEAESTGAHTQFYDKFNIRYEIFKVIQCIWPNPIYRKNLDVESKVNPEFFIRFVNLLLNDVTYVLGESFTSFNKIHNLQEELEAENSDLDDTQRAEKKKELEKEQGVAKSYMQLTNATVLMLKLFTEVLAEAFTMPEIVQRLADMLGYNLAAMVGPKQRDLKVRDAETYGFKPGALLADLISVYVNLAGQPTFPLAVARDGRSYNAYNLTHAADIMSRWGLKTPEELKTWLDFAAAAAAAAAADAQAEEDLGDIPDEFLDPLLYTLMDDPVILPNSRATVDRSTIRSHLLSDPHDPFNRMPLSIDDVVPNVELKQRIVEFKMNAKKRVEADKMDTAQS